MRFLCLDALALGSVGSSVDTLNVLQVPELFASHPVQNFLEFKPGCSLNRIKLPMVRSPC